LVLEPHDHLHVSHDRVGLQSLVKDREAQINLFGAGPHSTLADSGSRAERRISRVATTAELSPSVTKHPSGKTGARWVSPGCS